MVSSSRDGPLILPWTRSSREKLFSNKKKGAEIVEKHFFCYKINVSEKQ